MDKTVQLKIVKITKEYPPKYGKYGKIYAVAAQVEIDGKPSEREYLKAGSQDVLVDGWSGQADEKTWSNDQGETSISYWLKNPKPAFGGGGGRVVNEKSIHAQVALKCACEVDGSLGSVDGVLNTAEKFLEWIESHSK